MARKIIGWLVRTETGGRHRYWKVGAAEAAQAAAIAAETVNADVAQAVTSIPSHCHLHYVRSQGAATEITWESSPVTLADEAFKCEPCVGDVGKFLLEVTFDVVVPDDGTTHVEGCYRLSGGNWLVYYLRNDLHEELTVDTPVIIKDAVFSSGISGVDGLFPAKWLLNKKTIGEILAEAVGADGWIEVTGPDSLLLK